MKVGFFDSGVGGVTVLYEAMKQLNNVDYLYFADTANVPYGIKSKEAVKGYIFNAVDFIASKGVDALVVACNTATSIAISDLRRKFSFPILGMEPAIKPAVNNSDSRRVLVCATALTLKEEKFHKLVTKVDSNHIVDALPLPELVNYAENFIFDGEEVSNYLKEMFSMYDMKQYSAVVLGCTHFTFFRPVIRRLIPSHVDIIDGNLGTVKHLKNVIGKKLRSAPGGDGSVEFFSSGNKLGSDSKFFKYIDFLKSMNS